MAWAWSRRWFWLRAACLWWWLGRCFDIDYLSFRWWWWWWWCLAVDNWSWSDGPTCLLTHNEWWSCWLWSRSLLDNDELAWLWCWWLQVADSYVLTVTKFVSWLLANDNWIRVLVDLVLLEWNRALVLSVLLGVQAYHALVIKSDLLTVVGRKWVLGIQDSPLNVALCLDGRVVVRHTADRLVTVGECAVSVGA